MKPFPHLGEVLEELCGVNADKVFRWKHPSPYTVEYMHTTRKALGIVPRGFHALCKIRENEWIDVYKFPPYVTAYLCTHSVVVQEKNYRKKPRATVLEKLI